MSREYAEGRTEWGWEDGECEKSGFGSKVDWWDV